MWHGRKFSAMWHLWFSAVWHLWLREIFSAMWQQTVAPPLPSLLPLFCGSYFFLSCPDLFSSSFFFLYRYSCFILSKLTFACHYTFTERARFDRGSKINSLWAPLLTRHCCDLKCALYAVELIGFSSDRCVLRKFERMTGIWRWKLLVSLKCQCRRSSFFFYSFLLNMRYLLRKFFSSEHTHVRRKGEKKKKSERERQ